MGVNFPTITNEKINEIYKRSEIRNKINEPLLRTYSLWLEAY